MIGVFERNDPRAILAAMPPVTERHFDRDFDAGRTTVGIKHIIEAGRRDLDKTTRQRFRRFMGEAGENQLIELFRLIADRLHDLGPTMAMGDHPP